MQQRVLAIFRILKVFIVSMKSILLFFLILIIMLVAPSFAVAKYANNTIVQNIEQTNQNYLSTVSSTLDNTISSLANKAYMIAMNKPSEFNFLLHADSKYDLEFPSSGNGIASITTKFISDYDILDSMFIYFRSSDYLITQSGSYDFDFFINRYRSYERYPKDFWENIIDTNDKVNLLPSTLIFTTQNNGEKSVYGSVLPLVVSPIEETKCNAIVVLNIDQKKLNILIESLNTAESGYIYLMDTRTNEILNSPCEKDYAALLKLNKLQYDKQGKMEINEHGTYKIYYKHSSENNILYICVTPESLLAEQIKNFSIITILIIIISAFICLILSGSFVKWLYSSFTDAILQLKKINCTHKNIDDNICIESLKNEIRYVGEKQELNLPYLIQIFMFRAINNDITANQADEFFQSYGVFSADDYFKVVVVYLNFNIPDNSFTISEQNDFFYQINRIFSDKGYIVNQNGKEHQTIIMNSTSESVLNNNFNSLITNSQEYLKSLTIQPEIILGESSCFQNFCSCWRYYNQIRNFIEFRGVKQEKLIYNKNDISENREFYLSPQIKQNLLTYINHKDNNSFFNELNQLFQKMINCNIDFFRFRQISIELIYLLLEVVYTNKISLLDIISVDEKNLIDTFNHLLTTNSIITKCTELFCKLIDCIPYTKNISNEIDEFILRYIAENLKDISLTMLSDKLKMNQNYLSQYFKKHFGVTFLDYVIRQKIDKSKKLLETTNFTGKQIGEIIGFSDANVFIRTFKKIVKTTPNEYRKNLSLKE